MGSDYGLWKWGDHEHEDHLEFKLDDDYNEVWRPK